MTKSGIDGSKHPHLQACRGRELGISKERISHDAYDVVQRLQDAGYASYIVGGSVRDILLDKKAKDFDVATEAHPTQVRKVFRNCRIIGRRFKLVHIYFGRTIIEVATFRRGIAQDDDMAGKGRHIISAGGRIVRDNVYGTLDEDALRRDFTVNCIYYDPCSDTVICHEHALEDIRNRQLCLIGKAKLRCREDPVRILRAVRFSAKLDLQLEDSLKQEIFQQKHLLADIPKARLFDETVKLFHSGSALRGYQLLCEYELFEILFPLTVQSLQSAGEGKKYRTFLHRLFTNTDDRIAQEMPVTPAFILAGLWWLPVQHITESLVHTMSPTNALVEAIKQVMEEQSDHLSIPLRLRAIAGDILTLLPRLETLRKKVMHDVLEHQRFRATYDMYCLLSQSGLAERETCEWWSEIQTLDTKGRNRMINERLARRKKHGGKRQ